MLWLLWRLARGRVKPDPLPESGPRGQVPGCMRRGVDPVSVAGTCLVLNVTDGTSSSESSGAGGTDWVRILMAGSGGRDGAEQGRWHQSQSVRCLEGQQTMQLKPSPKGVDGRNKCGQSMARIGGSETRGTV